MRKLAILLILTLAFSAQAQTQTHISGVLQSTNEGETATLTADHGSEWGILNGVLEVQADAILGIDVLEERTDRLDVSLVANCEEYFFGAETRTQFGDLFDPRITRGKIGSGVKYAGLDIRYAAAVEFNRDEKEPNPGGEVSVQYEGELPLELGTLSVRVNGFAGRDAYRSVTVKNRVAFFASGALRVAVDHYLYHRHKHAPDNEVLLSLGYSF